MRTKPVQHQNKPVETSSHPANETSNTSALAALTWTASARLRLCPSTRTKGRVFSRKGRLKLSHQSASLPLRASSIWTSTGRIPPSCGAFRDLQTVNAARPPSSSSTSGSGGPAAPLILSASPGTSNRLLPSAVRASPIPLRLPHSVGAPGKAPPKLHGASVPSESRTKPKPAGQESGLLTGRVISAANPVGLPPCA
ncbi:hypothetical protein GOODEAATRI_030491 [Goodea atripinnis]|uniref:Uncharacterized protein n=1 Tax=Goodea atripinnis TaxID=208336 RepID=A0ABV0N5R3_9TELE